jgi:tripartite ATP-independent transporter DctM subunit
LKAAGPLGRTAEGTSQVVDVVTRVLYLISTVGFAAMTIASIIARYLFNSASLYWGNEVALTLFLWATFLSVGSGYRHDRHVAFTVLEARLTGPVSRVVVIIREAFSLSFLSLMLLSALEAWPAVAEQKSVALHTTLALPFASLIVGTGIMLIHWLARAARLFGLLAAGIVLVVAAAPTYAMWLPAAAYVDFTGPAKYAVILIAFLLPLLSGVPVAFSLGLLGFAFVGTTAPIQFVSAASTVYSGIESLTYLAIPLMILAGGLMFTMGLAQHLVNFAQIVTGRIPGGLAASDVMASAIFSDVSGSAVSDTAAIGQMVIPEMKRRGYDPAFAAAVQASAGTLGLMVPPAITLIIYATTFSLSVTALFAAALIPAAFLALGFIVVSTVISSRRGYPKERVPRRLMLGRTLLALPALFGGVIILGGILGGLFTPAEAGAVLVAYAIGLQLLARRLQLQQLGMREVFHAVVAAGHTSAMVLFLTATSTFVGFVLARDFIPSKLVADIEALTDNKYVILLLVNVLFILAGIILEAPAIIVGFLPSVVPLLATAGIDPIHFAVLFVVNAAIGMMHPPIGLTFFVARDIADVPVGRMFREIIPFMSIAVLVLCVLSVWPQIALLLPQVLYGYIPL